MGGIIFILPALLMAPIFLTKATPLGYVALAAAVAYGLLGFLDDFLKVKRAKNLGLRAYQKFIGQGGIAILVAVFYYMANPDGRMFVPFWNHTVDIGWGIIPLTILILVATTNSVNLTDGVDGLAGTVSLAYVIFIGVLMAFVSKIMPIEQSGALLALCAVTAGGLLCYLLFNTNKARVFMGDTGSLYLGGLIATVSLFAGLGLFIVILGVMFVLSAVSDIIQVLYFKLTHGKRVFRMAPFHHHLEKCGWTEARIVMLYLTITALAGTICILTLI